MSDKQLPGMDGAVIDPENVRGYLLSDSHPVGRFKAAFFATLGYDATNWEQLKGDLRGHALDNDAIATAASDYGQKYEVRGTLEGPNGKAAELVAVWIVLHDEGFPRFVTAFPGARA